MGWPSGGTWMQPGTIPSETISEGPAATTRRTLQSTPHPVRFGGQGVGSRRESAEATSELKWSSCGPSIDANHGDASVFGGARGRLASPAALSLPHGQHVLLEKGAALVTTEGAAPIRGPRARGRSEPRRPRRTPRRHGSPPADRGSGARCRTEPGTPGREGPSSAPRSARSRTAPRSAPAIASRVLRRKRNVGPASVTSRAASLAAFPTARLAVACAARSSGPGRGDPESAIPTARRRLHRGQESRGRSPRRSASRSAGAPPEHWGLASSSGTRENRTRSPGSIKVGGSPVASNIRADVRPISAPAAGRRSWVDAGLAPRDGDGAARNARARRRPPRHREDFRQQAQVGESRHEAEHEGGELLRRVEIERPRLRSGRRPWPPPARSGPSSPAVDGRDRAQRTRGKGRAG